METVFWILTGGVGLVLFLALLEPLTRHASSRWVIDSKQFSDEKESLMESRKLVLEQALERAREYDSSEDTDLQKDHSERMKENPWSARYWFGQLCSPLTLVAALGLIIEIPIIMLNADLLAYSFEILLGTAGNSMFILNIAGSRFVITQLHLYGLLISLCQAFIGAVYWGLRDNRNRTLSESGSDVDSRTFPSWLGLFTLLILVVLLYAEVHLRAQLGYIIGGSSKAVLNGVIALATAGTEVIAGIFIIHHFIVPLLLSFFLVLTWPLRALSGKKRKRPPKVDVHIPSRLKHPSGRIRTAIAGFLSAIDQAVMDPLRKVDKSIGEIMENIRGYISRNKLAAGISREEEYK